MAPTRRQFLGTAALASAFAGCLGDDGSNATTDDSDATTDDSDATVTVRTHDDHGDILAGPDGMTLYMFVPDGDTDGSACYDSCANLWPPLTVSASPTAGDGVTANLGTITREGGATQVVAGDWPLYYYDADSEPGDVTGQGVNDAWYVLGPDGTPKRPDGTGDGMESATVSVRTHDTLGDILVGPDGMTLYMFDSDTQGEEASSCTGGCADAWPPLTVEGDATAGSDVTAALTTFERDDGGSQVAADGWPLYYFGSDADPGDAGGQGANDVWYALRPDGQPVRDNSTPTDDGGVGY